MRIAAQAVIRFLRRATTPPSTRSAANTIMAHSGSVGTGGAEAEMVNVALAGAALLPLLVVSAPAGIVFV
jgi:hypothetical protein